MCCWEIVKNVQGTEIQLSATNPYVYNSGTGQMDKSDKHTNTLGQSLFHCFGEDIYLPCACSNVIITKLFLIILSLPSTLYSLLLFHSFSEDLPLLDPLFVYLLPDSFHQLQFKLHECRALLWSHNKHSVMNE